MSIKSMNTKRLLGICSLLGFTILLTDCSKRHRQTEIRPGEDTEVVVVPKIWDERELAAWATPVAGLGVRPGHFSEA
jgi:hypothetical protein